MEKEYFTWEAYDLLDPMEIQFYNCTIIKDFGPLKIGEKYNCILFDCRTPQCIVYDSDGNSIISFGIRACTV